METLIFHGSPRKNGDSAALLRELQELLPGKTTVIHAYTCGISPCVDCRWCWEHSGCAIEDGWQQVEEALRTCDSVVIASPVYFSELTGPMLSLLSRLQQYYCARAFRGKPDPFGPKRGGVILTGGGDGNPEKAAETARTLLRQMGCRGELPAVLCCGTNTVPALETPGVREELKKLANILTGGTV